MFGLCGATCAQGFSLGCTQPEAAFSESTPNFVPGVPHSPSPHIPWEFSFGLYEAEGLEKEGT